MNILTKLLISFISVALLCAIVGGVSLNQLGNTERGIRDLSDETIPKLDCVNRIDRSFRNIKTATRSIANPLSADDPEFLKRQEEIIKTARAQYADARKKFEALGMSAEEKAKYDKVVAQIEIAAPYNNSIIEAAEAARLAPIEQRDELYRQLYIKVTGEERLAMDDLLSLFEDLLVYDQRYYGVDIPNRVVAGAKLGKIIVLVIAIFAFIVALIFGVIQGRLIAGRLTSTVKVMNKIAHGDLSERLTMTTKDEFKTVAAALNSVEDNVSSLVADTGTLVDSALRGDLAVRADPEKHEGEYRKVIEGINSTLDAVLTPLQMAATYIDSIAKGNLPQKITEQYNGDFNAIKENLNLAIDSINALVSDTIMLSEAAVAGTLQTRADASRHQGDYRKIVDGINTTLDLMVTPLNELIEILKGMSDGDLSIKMTGDYRGDFDILKTSLNASLDSINDALRQINTAVEQVAEGSVQVSQASQALSQGATEQAASLEEITSSTTEISSQTKQNTENALRMNSLAREAQESAEKGNAQMKDLVSAMSDINTSAEEIRKIVKTIDDISFQINLLALNANVEAARAGKYGKGFAVVAEEVRNLAVRSANSVKDTTRMVDEAIGNIQKGNQLVEGTASQLDEIVGGAGQVSTIAEEVATAGREQTQGLDQIALGLNQIDQVTQSNTASAEESASASEELSSQAQQVKAMVARFKLDQAGTSRMDSARPEKAQKQTPVSVAAYHASVTPKKKTVGVSPAEVISLDDSNFGKF